jgi:hypothetical protein
MAENDEVAGTMNRDSMIFVAAEMLAGFLRSLTPASPLLRMTAQLLATDNWQLRTEN